MHRLEDEDILETFGWFIARVAAFGLAFVVLAFILDSVGWL